MNAAIFAEPASATCASCQGPDAYPNEYNIEECDTCFYVRVMAPASRDTIHDLMNEGDDT